MSSKEKCEVCKATGKLAISDCVKTVGLQEIEVACPVCEGNGFSRWDSPKTSYGTLLDAIAITGDVVSVASANNAECVVENVTQQIRKADQWPNICVPCKVFFDHFDCQQSGCRCENQMHRRGRRKSRGRR